MSIFDMFKPAAAPAPATPPAPNLSTPPGSPTPVNPGPTDPPPAPAPLEQHKDVWNNVNTPPQDPALFEGLDPQKLMESARQVDFAKVIKPEQLQAISQGGEGAVQAFAQAMNSVAQTVYAQNALATTKIVEQAIAKTKESSQSEIQAMMKKFSVGENLSKSNPLLTNPAVQPLVVALTETLTRKNPTASSSAIQAQVESYFKDLGAAFAPPAPSPANAPAVKSEDWEKFFSS